MYSLGGHNFEDFGFIAGQGDGSNIAMVGAWDAPSRTGKTYHEWAEEFEPYLRADEIFFSGRDIYLTFLIQVSTRQEAIEKIYSFYDILGDLKELKPLVNDVFGSFDVYVKNEIRVEYLGQGACKIVLPFRQPVVEIVPFGVVGDNQLPNIDGVSFNQLGMTLLKSDGDLDRPATKDGKFIIYGKEGYKITNPSFRTISLNLLVSQPTYIAFNNAIKSLTALLSAPNARVLLMDGYARECFAKDGFKVTSLYQQGVGYVGTIDLKLTEIRVLTDYTIFSDNQGNILTDGNGVPLSEIFKQQ